MVILVGEPMASQSLALKECRRHGRRNWKDVRVNWVDPGDMNTAMHRAAEPDEDPTQWANPADVTEVFIYLASDEYGERAKIPGSVRQLGQECYRTGSEFLPPAPRPLTLLILCPVLFLLAPLRTLRQRATRATRHRPDQVRLMIIDRANYQVEHTRFDHLVNMYALVTCCLQYESHTSCCTRRL